MPENIGRALLLYITYIRPFAHILYNQLQKLEGKEQQEDAGDHLFCNEGEATKIWMKGLTLILERESQILIKTRITMQRWRHIAVGVAKKHYRSRIAAYFANDEKECIELRNASHSAKLWDTRAKQTGHSLTTNIREYAVDTDYLSSLQSDELTFFRLVSREWQTFWTANLGAWSSEMWERSAINANPTLTEIDSSNVVTLSLYQDLSPYFLPIIHNSTPSSLSQVEI